MDTEDVYIEDEFVNRKICVDNGNSDSANDDQMDDKTLKENKKNITRAQCKKLIEFMNGRTGFTKGKMKRTAETAKFFDEWELFTLELNTMGPPCHSSSKWRLVWTRIKSKNKIKVSLSSSVLRNHNENSIKDRRCTPGSKLSPIMPRPKNKHENVLSKDNVTLKNHRSREGNNTTDERCTFGSNSTSVNPTSTNVKDDLKLETNRTLELLESISKKIDQFVEKQDLVNTELNSKIDHLTQQQEIADQKLSKYVDFFDDII